MDTAHLSKLAARLALGVNGLFLVYLIIVACADPTIELCTAVGFELALFAALFFYRQWRSKAPSSRALDSILTEIEVTSTLFMLARKTVSAICIGVLGAACLYMLVDLTALVCADLGTVGAATVIYERIAPPVVLGVHPGFSLELLTGAYIESGRYKKAEPLELALLKIRKSLVGGRHELIAAMLSNMGDFYRRWGKPQQAEANYRNAGDLSRELHLSQGYGSPLTKLASLLRDERRYGESERAFAGALAVRRRIFGEDSEKVEETLREYSVLKQREGKMVQASRMREQAMAIRAAQSLKPRDGGSSSVLLITGCLSLVVLLQRERLLLMAASFIRARNQKLRV